MAAAEGPPDAAKAKLLEAREKILDAALDLLAERGYARTTINSVALKAGFSKGGVYHHFGSKEQLLFGVIDREYGVLEAHARELTTSEDPLETMYALADTLLHQNERFVKLDAVVNSVCFSESDELREAAAEKVRGNYRLYQRILEGCLRSMMGEKMPDGTPTRGLAAALIGLMDGLFVQMRMGAELAPKEELIRAVQAIVGRLVGPYAARGGRNGSDKSDKSDKSDGSNGSDKSDRSDGSNSSDGESGPR